MANETKKARTSPSSARRGRLEAEEEIRHHLMAAKRAATKLMSERELDGILRQWDECASNLNSAYHKVALMDRKGTNKRYSAIHYVIRDASIDMDSADDFFENAKKHKGKEKSYRIGSGKRYVLEVAREIDTGLSLLDPAKKDEVRW